MTGIRGSHTPADRIMEAGIKDIKVRQQLTLCCEVNFLFLR